MRNVEYNSMKIKISGNIKPVYIRVNDCKSMAISKDTSQLLSGAFRFYCEECGK